MISKNIVLIETMDSVGTGFLYPCEYGKEDIRYLPLVCYMLRWDIEVSYYENKTFWSLEEYHVRSREGIERLVNLECIAYSAMTLLPYSDEFFLCY